MERRTVQLRVAGQTCRVVTSVSDVDLKRFAAVVESKLSQVQPRGRAPAPHAMLLVALALAHEVEEAREMSVRRDSRARAAFSRLIARIDTVLAGDPGTSSTPAPTS
jgi:cell division protein ZapA